MAHVADLSASAPEVAALFAYFTQLRDGAISHTAPVQTVSDTVAGTAQPGAPFTVTIYNYQKTALNFSLAVQGGASSAFTLGTQIPSGQPASCASNQVPISTGPAASCTISVTVTFHAPSIAAPAKLLAVSDNLRVTLTPAVSITGQIQPEAIALSANAVLPEVIADPVAPFPPTLVGTTSAATRTVTLTNPRSKSVSYLVPAIIPSSAAATLTGADEFVILSESCPTRSITANNGTCELVIQFSPRAPLGTGSRAALLQLQLQGSGGDADPLSLSIGLSGTASPPGPAFALTPDVTSLPFSASLGSSTTASAVISNTGGTGFVINTLTFGGTNSGDYAPDATNTCAPGVTVDAGHPCDLVVRFTPLASGDRVASISIDHGAPGSPRVLTLLGTTLGRLDVSAPSLTFPSTTIGASAPTQSITVSHGLGGDPVTLSAISIAGIAVTDYQRAGSCTVGLQLLSGQSCTVDITFIPTVAGSRDALPGLTVTSNAINPIVTVALMGTGTNAPAPIASLSPSNLAFGTQSVGGIYPTRQVTLTNSGNAPLTSIVVTVTGQGFIKASPPGPTACGSTLAPLSSCTIDISYAPTAPGSNTGTLTVGSNAIGSPGTTTLNGTAVSADVPVLLWSPVGTQLEFPPTSSGTVSAVQSVFLLNQGPGGAKLQVVNAIGRDGSSFVVSTGTCPITTPLFEGESCRLDVRFAPGTAGAKTATVQVVSNGTAPPTLALTGSGLGSVAAGLAVSPPALSFEGTQIGAQSAPLDVAISGTNSGVVNVTALEVTGPFAVQNKTCPALPFVLRAGSECTVTVIFKPVNEGVGTGTLHVRSDASTRDVALSGNGEPKPDLSSGGCSIAPSGSVTDPTLWVAMGIAVAAILNRRPILLPKQKGKDRRP
jgi:hypothetical protein